MSLISDQLKHEVYLQRIATEMLRANVYPSLDAAYKAIRLILLDAEEIRTPAQLNRITKAINKAVKDNLSPGWDATTKEYTALAVYEASYYANLVGTSAGVALSVPGNRTITDYVNSALLALGEGNRAQVGAWAEFVDRNVSGLTEQINNIVKAGYVRGATVGQLTTSIRQFSKGLARQQAEALARTGALHYANAAREAMFQDNLDIADRRFYLSLLDNRTTLGCRGLFGKTWKLTDDDYVRLPRHMNCRSSYVLLLKGQDYPDGLMPAIGSGKNYPKDADKKPTYKGRRDIGKFDIEQVPADITPDEWMRGQSQAFIEDSLGAKRAKLFLDGNLKIERMSDTFGNPLTLDQLFERDSAAFNRAGVKP